MKKRNLENRVIELYLAGKTYHAIADELQICVPTVYYHVKKHGLINTRSGNPKAKIADDVCKKVCERYQNGDSFAAIASEFGIGATTVYRILHRYGIHPHRSN